jgi:L-asparaginase
VTIHAIDAKGNHKVVAVNGAGGNTYWLWHQGEAAPTSMPAEPLVITSAAAKPTAGARYAR